MPRLLDQDIDKKAEGNADSFAKNISSPRIINQVLLGLLIIWTAHAWVYASDVQTQLEVNAPFLPKFQILAQLICAYCLVMLTLTGGIKMAIQHWMIFLVIIWGAISATWSEHPANTLAMVRVMVLMVLAAVYFRRRLSTSDLMQTFAVTAGLIMLGSAASAMLLDSGRAAGAHVGAWRGLFGHKNGLGELAAFSILLLLAYSVALRRIVWWVAGLLVVSIACCVMAGSANAFATVIVGVSVTALALVSTRLTPLRWLNACIFVLGTAIVLFIAFKLVQSAVEYADRDMTFTGRTEIWRNYLRYAAQKPWTGWGWTSASNDEIVGPIRAALRLPYLRSTHNAYVNLRVELGYVGLGLYLLWLVTTTVRALLSVASSESPSAIPRAAIAVGMGIFGFFEAGVGAVVCVWLFFLLCTIPNARAKRVRAPQQA